MSLRNKGTGFIRDLWDEQARRESSAADGAGSDERNRVSATVATASAPPPADFEIRDGQTIVSHTKDRLYLFFYWEVGFDMRGRPVSQTFRAGWVPGWMGDHRNMIPSWWWAC